MKRNIVITCFRFAIAIILMAAAQVSLATNTQNTIYNTSVNLSNADKVNELLKSLPAWDDKVIKQLFDAYLHPTKFKLPAPASKNIYNLQFIHVFWGPLNNTFNKYTRPAKVFVFLNESEKTFFVAPLIQNAADKNYYIFDKDQTKPLLLTDWLNQIRPADGKAANVRINVCTGYGSLPTDSCDGTSYQKELNTSLTSDKTFTAASSIVSAHRPMNENWRQSAKRVMKSKALYRDSIYDSSIDWNNEKARNKLLSTTVSWPNLQTIQANFEKLRDIRYFADEQKSDFMRRMSWLYPDDGCWTRASAVIKDLFGPLNNKFHQYPRPSKVFLFGNLCVNTTNSPHGAVAWWYHTAPIIKDESTNITYVLDPAVNPHKPLSMDAWVAEITAKTGRCASQTSMVETFNICNGYGSGPNHTCNTQYKSEAGSVLGQPGYQREERERQIQLGRDADAVLGNQPPWLQ